MQTNPSLTLSFVIFRYLHITHSRVTIWRDGAQKIRMLQEKGTCICVKMGVWCCTHFLKKECEFIVELTGIAYTIFIYSVIICLYIIYLFHSLSFRQSLQIRLHTAIYILVDLHKYIL